MIIFLIIANIQMSIWMYHNVANGKDHDYRTSPRAVETNLSDDHSILLQLRLHQGHKVAEFDLKK